MQVKALELLLDKQEKHLRDTRKDILDCLDIELSNMKIRYYLYTENLKDKVYFDDEPVIDSNLDELNKLRLQLMKSLNVFDFYEVNDRGNYESKKQYEDRERGLYYKQFRIPMFGWSEYEMDDQSLIGIWVSKLDMIIYKLDQNNIETMIRCPSKNTFQAELHELKKVFGKEPPFLDYEEFKLVDG